VIRFGAVSRVRNCAICGAGADGKSMGGLQM
jgi:hypothetical protein